MSEFKALLLKRLDGLISIEEDALSLLEAHYSLLLRWNARVNLTAVEGLESIVERHYCESAFLSLHLPAEHHSAVDIGSGPGFPGIPLAILRPHLQVTLVEANGKKAVFLREATRDLANASVLHTRAETIPSGTFDWLVSRAVQPRDIAQLVPRLAGQVALLLGEADSLDLRSCRGFDWNESIRLPWGARRVLLIGRSTFHVERKDAW